MCFYTLVYVHHTVIDLLDQPFEKCDISKEFYDGLSLTAALMKNAHLMPFDAPLGRNLVGILFGF